MAHTNPVVRGCGTRSEGGVYLECGLGTGPNAKPLENFIICPPMPIDKDRLGLSDIGVKLIQDEKGVYHVFDIVGAENYPNVADFGEEVRRFGLSRKVAVTTDFHLLTRDSRIVILHRRGYIHNSEEYFAARSDTQDWTCPQQRPTHTDKGLTPPMCASLWWEDVSISDRYSGMVDTGRHLVRKMPSFSYHAQTRPDGVVPTYQLAVCFSFPITNIAVIAETNADGQIVGGGRHDTAVKKLSSELRGISFSLDKG